MVSVNLVLHLNLISGQKIYPMQILSRIAYLMLAILLFSSCQVMSDSLRPHGLQHVRPPYPSSSPGVYPSSCPLNQWCRPTIYTLLPSSPFAFNLSQLQDLFQWVCSSYQVAKVLKLPLQHWSFQWVFKVDFLQNGLVGSPCSPRDSWESSSAPQFESINSLALCLLYGPTLTPYMTPGKTIVWLYGLCWQSNLSAF